jgi:hypothetical protein
MQKKNVNSLSFYLGKPSLPHFLPVVVEKTPIYTFNGSRVDTLMFALIADFSQ